MTALEDVGWPKKQWVGNNGSWRAMLWEDLRVEVLLTGGVYGHTDD